MIRRFFAWLFADPSDPFASLGYDALQSATLDIPGVLAIVSCAPDWYGGTDAQCDEASVRIEAFRKGFSHPSRRVRRHVGAWCDYAQHNVSYARSQIRKNAESRYARELLRSRATQSSKEDDQ